MLHPSYSDLMNAVNSNADGGEHPVIQSRYSIVIAAAKRARQLIDGDEPLVAGAAGKKPLSTAIEELYEQKVTILSSEKDEEDGAEPDAAAAVEPEQAELEEPEEEVGEETL